MNQSEDQDEFEITFDSTFPFEWDDLYIFDSYIYPDEISKSLGYDCDCDYVEDPDEQIFFSKNGKKLKSYITDCRRFSFVKMKENGVTKLTKESRFWVEKRLLNGRPHYYIFPLEERSRISNSTK